MNIYGSDVVIDIYEKNIDNLSLNEIERILTANNGKPISNIEDNLLNYIEFKNEADSTNNFDDWFTNSDSEDISF